MEEKAKDIPSLLPLAPGGVYSVKWENRIKWGKQVDVEPVEYTPPFPVNPSNPLCFLEIRSGGYYMGKVVVELKQDVVPTTCDNFRQLCEFKCYTGSMMQVWPEQRIESGDFTVRDPLVWSADDPECFDFDTLLPDALPGGQSIYGGYFDDENFELAHSGAGVLSMCTHAPNANGSRFTLTLRAQPDRDGKHVAFGQVVEGYEILNTLSKVGAPHQDGTTFQRVSIEACGVQPPASPTATTATATIISPSAGAAAPAGTAGAIRRARTARLAAWAPPPSLRVQLRAQRVSASGAVWRIATPSTRLCRATTAAVALGRASSTFLL